MKAISLWQPWASAIALGLKRFETRGWSTNYRGPIAIHAAKKVSREQEDIFKLLMCRGDFGVPMGAACLFSFSMLPKGAIVAVADLREVLSTTPIHRAPETWNELEYKLGDYTPGRFAWRLENVRALVQHYGFTGHQGFFEVPEIPEECFQRVEIGEGFC